MKIFKLFIMVILLTVEFCFAGNGNFYTDPGRFMAKLSGTCPSGNVVQAILQNGSTSVAPSNTPPYLGTGERISTSPQKCDMMGVDKLYEFYYGDGKLGSVNTAPDTHMFGYIRAFSCTSIVDSAYFGNSPCVAVNSETGGASDNPIASNVLVSTVNPAYIIRFDNIPTNGSVAGEIIGSVYATTAGANNQLESAFVLIEWRYAGATLWTVGASSLSGNYGDFDFTISVPQHTNVFVRARVKDTNTPMPGFPISEEFQVAINPLPAVPIVSITSPNGGNDYSVSIGAHSTNIIGTVDSSPDLLYWTNTLNNTGGSLSPSTAFSFNALLDLGVNTISVYAANAGGTGNDSINITVNPIPLPSVDITTSNILANSWPVVVEGVSSGANSVILSNTITAVTFPCLGTDNWSVSLTGNDNTAQNYVAVAINDGGTSVSSPVLIDHDNIPPTVHQTSPDNNFTSTSANVTFLFTATDDRHSIAYTQIRFDSGSWQAFSSSNSATFTEGEHTWEIRAADNAGTGNISLPSEERIFFVFTPPSVAFTYPVNSGTFNTNGAVNMIIQVGGIVSEGSSVILSNLTTATKYNAIVSATGWSVTNVALVRGANVLTVIASRNDIASSSAQIIINNQEPGTPVVAITSPNGGNNYSVNIGEHLTNFAGSIDIMPDVLSWSNSLSATGGTLSNATNFNFQTTLLVGTNVISVYASRAGKTGIDTISIIVSEPAPVVAFLNPIENGTYLTNGSNNMTIPIDGTVTEGSSVILSNVSTHTEYIANVVGDAWYVAAVTLLNGTNELVAIASRNNISSTPAKIIIINQEITVVTITSPNNGNDFSIVSSPHLTNIVGTVSVIPDSLVWSNYLTGAGGSLSLSNSFDFPVELAKGENVITVTAVKNENEGTATITITLLDSSPYIQILNPTNWTSFPTPEIINVSGIATDDVAVVSITRNGYIITNNFISPDWSDTITPDMLVVGSNFFSYVATDSDGNSATDSVCYIVLSNNVPEYTARVLETWPRYIGKTQTGTVEFVSKSTAEWNLFVVNSLTSNTPIESGVCSSGWNLIDFYGGNLPITDDDYSNILKLVIGSGENTDSLDASAVTVVKDLNVTGAPTGDFDDDLIYVKFNTKSIGKISAKGRTLFIEDASPKDKLIVKVKPAKGRGDGVAAICGVISKSSISSIKIRGDLDRININGSLNKLILIGGSLGRPNESMRYNAIFNTELTTVKTKILIKTTKNKTNSSFIPANCYANILSGELIKEPYYSANLTGIKLLKIIGGNIGVPYNEISKKTCRHWLNAKYTDFILVKPKAKTFGGKVFDYSFYFTGENIPGKGSFKKMFLYNGCEDSSENNKNNINIICGYSSITNVVFITGTNWIGADVKYTFGKIISKAGELQGTVVISKWLREKNKQVKGLNDVYWIVNGKLE